MNSLSIIIPCYNEEEVLEMTYQSLTLELKKIDRQYEILFINDGSRDRTFEIIESLSKKDSCVGGISLSRNFGKEGVIKAGLAHAKGDLIVVMDADLQDPPSLIPEMIRLIEEEDYDQVGTYRSSRKSQGIATRLFSEAYYRTYNFFSDVKVPINEREYRMMSRKVVNTLLLFSEQNRYIKSLWSWVGFKTTHIGYEDIDRAAGKTKYNIKNKLKLAKHNILASSDKPLKFVSGFMMVYGVLMFVYTLYAILVSNISMNLFWGWMMWMQLVILSVISDYVGKIYLESKHRPNYIITKNIKSGLKVEK